MREWILLNPHMRQQDIKDLISIFDKVNPEDLNGENWYLAFAAYNCRLESFEGVNDLIRQIFGT